MKFAFCEVSLPRPANTGHSSDVDSVKVTRLIVVPVDRRHANVAKAAPDRVKQWADEGRDYRAVHLVQTGHLDVARLDAWHEAPDVAEGQTGECHSPTNGRWNCSALIHI